MSWQDYGEDFDAWVKSKPHHMSCEIVGYGMCTCREWAISQIENGHKGGDPNYKDFKAAKP